MLTHSSIYMIRQKKNEEKEQKPPWLTCVKRILGALMCMDAGVKKGDLSNK